MDNLAIKGIESDKPHHHGKKRGGRKSFVIDAILVRSSNAPARFSLFGLGKWWVWGRYKTALRRDQALAALVKKELATKIPRWSHWKFRKRDD